MRVAGHARHPRPPPVEMLGTPGASLSCSKPKARSGGYSLIARCIWTRTTWIPPTTVIPSVTGKAGRWSSIRQVQHPPSPCAACPQRTDAHRRAHHACRQGRHQERDHDYRDPKAFTAPITMSIQYSRQPTGASGNTPAPRTIAMRRMLPANALVEVVRWRLCRASGGWISLTRWSKLDARRTRRRGGDASVDMAVYRPLPERGNAGAGTALRDGSAGA